MSILNDAFANRLSNAPAPSEVVHQLFKEAKSASEERTYLTVVDLETTMHDDKSFLTCKIERHWMIEQFAEYFTFVNRGEEQFAGKVNTDIFRRMQMLVYSQFWECLGIQRLLFQLVGIISGEQYQARLLLDNRPKAYTVYKEIRDKSDESQLQLSELLRAVYSNQIRNAFSHSDIWVVGEYITFHNYDASKEYHIPSITLETWDELYKLTSEFIIALFKERRECALELKSRTPYRVALPEFMAPFSLSKDRSGYWSAAPVN